MLVPSELVRGMRSLRVVRRFSERPVTDDVLRDMLAVARWTGTSKNSQPWHLVVVRERETLRALSKLGQFAGHVAGANVAIALVMDGKANAFDCGRIAERLMLAAWAHGIGSCIGSIWPDDNEKRAKELLGVPQERWLHQVISFGHPQDPSAAQVRTSTGVATLRSLGRRPLAELVSWERFGTRR